MLWDLVVLDVHEPHGLSLGALGIWGKQSLRL